MDSSTHQSYQNQNSQSNPGLLRFRSAPSSLLASFTETLDCGANKGGFDSPRFMNTSENKSGTEAAINYVISRHSYSGLPPHYPRQSSSTMDSSYQLLGMDQHSQSKSVTSSLMRQTSSPPGLLTNLSVQNGYGSMKGLGNYLAMNGTNGELSPSSNRLKNQSSFSSRLPSSLGILSQIPESDNESIGANSPVDAKLGSGYEYGSWDDSGDFPDNFSCLKTIQNDNGGRVNVLSRHLSLPNTSNEMIAMEKFLNFQDSVPCKLRAKRGCATHPRSIAERVRRTRISERMRKLQELVPNMDKQTNTADMLDLAVEYIKDLQKQFKVMKEGLDWTPTQHSFLILYFFSSNDIFCRLLATVAQTANA